jgi:hypothetical protein
LDGIVKLAWAILVTALAVTPAAANGWLAAVREDVRDPASETDPPPKEEEEGSDEDDGSHFHLHFHDCDDDDGLGFGKFVGWFTLYCVTSPIWGPHYAVSDDLGVARFFPRFPYEGGQPGYMRIGAPPGGTWRYGGRFRADFARDFDDLERTGGHMLLSTSSRFGLDVELSRFEESLHGGARDRLWMGDCNVTFRFAQSDRSQWRAGLGFNWLDDPVDTDFGFNFTYGFDFFPHQPWVLSTELDWGTLGEAELFHFRSTAGVIVWSLESYVGYEYWDIDRSQTSMWVAGVRAWF